MNNTNDRNIEIVDTEFGKSAYLGSNVEPVMDFIKNKGIKGVIVSFDKGYRNTNVDFLKDFSFLEFITIQYYGKIDISAIHYLNGLKKIALNIIANDNQLIDFSCFPVLETCFFDWRPKAKSIFHCKTLKDLRISKLRKDDLVDFIELSNLDTLVVSSSPVKSLKGIDNLNLSKLHLSYLTKLDSLSHIEGLATSIQELNIHACKKINNIEPISILTNLNNLGITNCGDIESIKPIRELKKLYKFEFWESTNIIDGDLTPCLSLKKVAFQNRKHYTHTWDEIDKLLIK